MLRAFRRCNVNNQFDREIKFPDVDHIGQKSEGAPRVHTQGDSNRKTELQELESILLTDPLYKLNQRDMELLRKYRVCFSSWLLCCTHPAQYEQKNRPQALPKVLRAIDYSSFEAANEVCGRTKISFAFSLMPDCRSAAHLGDASTRGRAGPA